MIEVRAGRRTLGRGRADVALRMLAVISYRRADSQDIAGRIADHLRHRLGDAPGLPRCRQHSRGRGFPPHHPGSVAPARRADRDRRAGVDGRASRRAEADQRSRRPGADGDRDRARRRAADHSGAGERREHADGERAARRREGLRLSQRADHRPRPQFPPRRRRARARDRDAGPASRLAAPDGRGAGRGCGGVSRRLDRGTARPRGTRCGASWRRRRSSDVEVASFRVPEGTAGAQLPPPEGRAQFRRPVQRREAARARGADHQPVAGARALHARRRHHRAVRAGHGHRRAARRARSGGGVVADRGARSPSSKRSTRSSRKR